MKITRFTIIVIGEGLMQSFAGGVCVSVCVCVCVRGGEGVRVGGWGGGGYQN